jgi:hypothetical protein
MILYSHIKLRVLECTWGAIRFEPTFLVRELEVLTWRASLLERKYKKLNKAPTCESRFKTKPFYGISGLYIFEIKT